MKKILLFIAAAASLFALTACGETVEGNIDTIVLGDAQWDSLALHNEIAGTIIEEGYGYNVENQIGSSAAINQGVREGEINVYMEFWVENLQDFYDEATEAGDIESISTNFDDNAQGMYVPTYMIEGDDERGIEPMAPDLERVEDLKNYAHLFEDPEDPNKGRIIGGPVGWLSSDQMATKVETYGLDEMYNYFRPGSEAALVASLTDAYESGEPWVGLYWTPTIYSAKYDLTLLEEEPFDPDTFYEDFGTAYAPVNVDIVVHKDFKEQAPDVYEFLSNYETSTALTEDGLALIEQGATAEEAAIQWLNDHEELWTSWVSEDIVSKVKEAIQ